MNKVFSEISLRTDNWYREMNTKADWRLPNGVDESDWREKFAKSIVEECIMITRECSGKVHPDDLITLFTEHFELTREGPRKVHPVDFFDLSGDTPGVE